MSHYSSYLQFEVSCQQYYICLLKPRSLRKIDLLAAGEFFIVILRATSGLS